FGLVICVPDDFGVRDIKGIYDAGMKCNVEIVDTIPETMAYALYVYYFCICRMLNGSYGTGKNVRKF
ncbi:MAG: hypothetical protein J6U00_08175, partial [Ruminococcus sp.]|uniref:hypothetical protein n=1 Tax=Ruminococcus sp. TaxID=41978 RepID=UPI001B2E30C2